MMRRLSHLAFCFVLFGCGKNISPKELNEPCTRTDQCVVGLVCLSGVCLPAVDAGLDGSIDPDGGS
jgi:hypothetical protein